MPQYIGFSTINADKPKTTNTPTGVDGGPGGILKSINTGRKFRLVDETLVVQDFINALNIRQGQKVGNPGYGTTLWDFVFEPNTPDIQFKLQAEIQRVASQDPRLVIENLRAFPKENGILLEMQVAVVPFNEATLLSIFFNANTNSAVIQ